MADLLLEVAVASTFEWALQHLELGYCPIPTIRGSKGCCVLWKPWQTAKPGMDEILGWWPEWAVDRNIALITGAFHRLVIVDADDEESVRFAKLQFGPTPYRVRTRRGMHFYFRHPGPGVHVQTKANVFGPRDKGNPAIDVRGDGGMCTGLGSVHASGFVYRLDDGADLCSVLDLPVWDPSWLPKPEPLKPPTIWRGAADLGALERAERYLAKVGGAGKGGRNQHTFRVASAVVRDFGLSFEQGWALMSQWNTVHNDPPLPEDELRGIVRSCLQSGRSPVGWRILRKEVCRVGASATLRSSMRRLGSSGGCR